MRRSRTGRHRAGRRTRAPPSRRRPHIARPTGRCWREGSRTWTSPAGHRFSRKRQALSASAMPSAFLTCARVPSAQTMAAGLSVVSASLHGHLGVLAGRCHAVDQAPRRPGAQTRWTALAHADSRRLVRGLPGVCRATPSWSPIRPDLARSADPAGSVRPAAGAGSDPPSPMRLRSAAWLHDRHRRSRTRVLHGAEGSGSSTLPATSSDTSGNSDTATDR